MADSSETRSVEFRLSLEDLVEHAHWQVCGSRTLLGRVGTWLVPLIAVVYYLWVQRSEGGGLQFDIGLAVVAMAGALISLALNLPFTKMWIRRSIKRNLGAKLRQPELWLFHVHASPEGLRVIHDDVDQLVKWRKVAAMVEHEDHLYVTVGEQGGTVIVPKNAFPSATEYSAFAEAICAHRQSAAEQR